MPCSKLFDQNFTNHLLHEEPQIFDCVFVFCVYPRNHTTVNSKVIAVTVRPEPKATESQLEIELAHLENVRTTLMTIFTQ